MKITLLLAALAAMPIFSQSAPGSAPTPAPGLACIPKIAIQYDKIRDTTTITTLRRTHQGFDIELKATYTGKHKPKDAPLYFFYMITRVSPEWRYLKSHDFACVAADGSRTVWAGDDVHWDGDTVAVYVTVKVERENLEHMKMGAKCVLSNDAFSFEDEFLDNIAGVLRMTESPASPVELSAEASQ